MRIRPITSILGAAALGWSLLTAPAFAACPAGPPGCHPTNPHYLSDASGEPLYLAGSHIWNNFQDWGNTSPPSALNFTGYLDFLDAKGHNFIRGWIWEQARWIPWDANGGQDLFIAPSPYIRSCPNNALDGKPQFVLRDLFGDPVFNPSYFSDLRQRIQAANARGIYVGVMLFQGWSFKRAGLPGDPWQGHPFNKANNCSGVDGDPSTGNLRKGGTGNGSRVHSLALPQITELQEYYVARMIDELNDLDNIIWEIANESTLDLASTPPGVTPASVLWQHHMIDFIKNYEATFKPKQHLVWMTGATNYPDSYLFSSNADVISPGLAVYKNPPLANTSKIVILDTDHLWGLGGDRIWVWHSFMRGYHPIYMDPDFGLPLFTDPIVPDALERERIRKAMGATIDYAQRLDLASVTPRNDPALCGTAHCLVDEGNQYLIFQDLHSLNAPGGDNSFIVSLPAGTYYREHFDIFTNTLQSTDTFAWGGGGKTFQFNGRPVVYLEHIGAPDTEAPRIHIGQPAGSAFPAFDTAWASGWALDEGMLDAADFSFKIDNTSIGIMAFTYGLPSQGTCDDNASVGSPNCPNARFRFAFDTTPFSNGMHALTMTVTDPSGNVAQTSSMFTIDNRPTVGEPPRVWMGSPSEGQTVTGFFAFLGWAIDDQLLSASSIRFEVDGWPAPISSLFYGGNRAGVCSVHADLDSPNCPNVGWSFVEDTGLIFDGNHVIRLIVEDSDGNRSVFTRSFNTINW